MGFDELNYLNLINIHPIASDFEDTFAER